MKLISGFDPSKKLYMVRNPNYDYTDTSKNNVDGIKIDVNTNLGDIFDLIEQGELDASLGQEQPPGPVLQRYLTDPAKRPYLHTDLADATGYLSMNLTVPLFDVTSTSARRSTGCSTGRLSYRPRVGQAVVQPATHAIPPTVLNGRLEPSTTRTPPRATAATRPGQGGDEAVQVRQQQGRGL